MIKRSVILLLITILAFTTAGCSDQKENSGVVASAEEMTEVEEVTDPGMEPVAPDEINDGTYEVTMRSSSSMFNPEKTEISISGGSAEAFLYMSSRAYMYIYPGTAEEAADADDKDLIALQETGEDTGTFILPVKALDEGIKCAAYSRRKEKWYDRTLLFEADSLPDEAFKVSRIKTAEDLGISDGEYLFDVELEGGSGKASVDSPAPVTVKNGECTAVITWSSPNYDLMIVDGTEYLPVNTDGNSQFEIPVKGFGCRLKVQAETTAMSEPHLIDYTLKFGTEASES